MIQTAIARRYAKALFALQAPAEVGQTAGALRVLADAFTASCEFRNLLLSPVFTREQKAAVVARVTATTACPLITERFLAHVVRKNRSALLNEISDAFGALADQASNRKMVQVSAARPLTDEQQAAIRTTLEQVTRSRIDLVVHVDHEVIGGMALQIGSTVYDGTIRGRLAHLRSALARA